MAADSSRSTKQRLNRLAWLMDQSIPLPIGNFRIGLDGLLSLIPVAGDAVSAMISSYLVAEAVRLGAPKTVIARMGVNVAIDTLIGMIPLVGDLFDFAWKANVRNVKLLENYVDQPRRVKRRSGLLIWGAAALALLLLMLLLWLGIMLLQALWSLLTG